MAETSELTIENFGCWNVDIHSDSIVGSDFTSIYPRGVGGKGEHLVAKIHKCWIPRDGKLSFVGSDGYVFCSQGVYADSQGGRRTFTGPKFEEVVARIRENEHQHKDRLILRWERPGGLSSYRISTVIEAYSLFFQIKPEMFVSDSGETTSIISYNIRGRDVGDIFVKALKKGSTLEDAKIQFILESNTKNKYIARTSIWIVNGGNIIRKWENDCLLHTRSHKKPFPEIPLKELFENGSLTRLRCKIITDRLHKTINSSNDPLLLDIKITDFSNTSTVISNPNTESSSVQQELQPENAVTVLTEDLMCLYQDHDFSDFEMRCGTVSFPTHKNILSSRSPVLKAMLSGDMREAASGHVDVEDLDPHTLGRFLAFLYSGTSGDLEWEGALKLYYAADKYQVPSLKKECVAVLRVSVSLGNVCDILSLAEKHQDEQLRSVAQDFILENYTEVLGSDNWDKLMMKDPLLVAKTVTHFAKNKRVKKSDYN